MRGSFSIFRKEKRRLQTQEHTHQRTLKIIEQFLSFIALDKYLDDSAIVRSLNIGGTADDFGQNLDRNLLQWCGSSIGVNIVEHFLSIGLVSSNRRWQGRIEQVETRRSGGSARIRETWRRRRLTEQSGFVVFGWQKYDVVLKS